MPALISPFTVASILGIAFGLGLLIKGMAGQRRAARIGDTATSTISAIAVAKSGSAAWSSRRSSS